MRSGGNFCCKLIWQQSWFSTKYGSRETVRERESEGEWVGERDSKSAMQQAAVAVAVAVAAAEHARVKPSYLCRNNRNLVN